MKPIRPKEYQCKKFIYKGVTYDSMDEVKKEISTDITYSLMVKELREWIDGSNPKNVINTFLGDKGKEICYDGAFQELLNEVEIVKEPI